MIALINFCTIYTTKLQQFHRLIMYIIILCTYLGSVTALAGVLGVLLSAKFVNLVGRRRTLSILAAVMFISWIGVALSPSAIVMLAFR